MCTKNPFEHHLRLKKPCANCPFLKEGGVELVPGRLEGIVDDLIKDDRSTFHCHKLVYSKAGGHHDGDGHYVPSGHEAMCAGAAAVLMKRGRPTITMRYAFVTGQADPKDWDSTFDEVID